MKLLLDEHLSPVVAIELRRLGYDVVCVAELPQLRGLDDVPLVRWAAAHERVLVSADRATMPNAAEAARADGGHGGVVIVNPDRFSLSRRNQGRSSPSLRRSQPRPIADEVVNNVMWL